MKLIAFEIKNFRSIKKSGICYITSPITILAGKNESGKTNIIEALEKFNKIDFKKSDKFDENNNIDPIEVILIFEIESG